MILSASINGNAKKRPNVRPQTIGGNTDPTTNKTKDKTNCEEQTFMTISAKISWGKIFIFYLVAFGISALFNSGFLTSYYQKLTTGLLINNWAFLPAGLGTLIAAFIAYKYDKKCKRTISLSGKNHLKNILIALVPAMVFSAIGIYNNNSINEHVYGLAFSLVALLYAVTEEIFWRGYLLDVLRPLNKITYSLVIGILWWAWHFRFNTRFDFTWFVLICLISSFLLCQFANETKSYLTAAGLHSLIIITTSDGEMTKAKTIGLCISIAIWLIMGNIWKTKEVIKKT
ncbi:MAG: type II CAAX endopeptidase family protein [Niabella sp.]